MVSTWTSGLNIPPPSYEEATGVQNHLGFTFVDFLPVCCKSGGIITSPEYESFRILIDRANEWLRVNRQWEVTTCESVEFNKPNFNPVDTNKMVYLEYGESATVYIRGLRLWLTERKKDSGREQQIGYVNLIPEQTKAGGLFTSPTFENLDQVLAKFNSVMQHSNPLPGRVITIESQEMKLPSSVFSNPSELNPDRSCWTECGKTNYHFLFVIRIFYELSGGKPEEIGLADFIPGQVSKGGIFRLPDHEPFHNIVRKASDWCSKQQGIRFVNAQSVEMKMHRGSHINTREMNYWESGSMNTIYLRVLRVAFTREPGSYYSEDKNQLTQLTCRTFIPLQIKRGIFMPEYETLGQTRERITAWMRVTGARVLSAETVALRLRHGIDTQATVSYNLAERNEYWIYVIRLYFNGDYHEPPQEMLPPVPMVQQSRDCTIM